jgi:hypothetical protein
LAVAILVAVLGALGTVSFASSAFGKEKPEEFARTYNHTYSGVFQATQEAIERMGMFVADKDKDKGTFTGDGDYQGMTDTGPRRIPMAFDILIESVSTKPETRVTILRIQTKGVFSGQFRKPFASDLLAELQRVLATYK